ncbi:MAG: hypothetical protein ACLPT6_11825 [Desulfobaccales bacterium]
MTAKGIVEKILSESITLFENSDHNNAAAAKLLAEGMRQGKFNDSEWIANILSNTDDSKEAEGPPSEDSES